MDNRKGQAQSFRTATTRSETSDSSSSDLYGGSHYFRHDINDGLEYSQSDHSLRTSSLEHTHNYNQTSNIDRLEFDLSNISIASSLTMDIDLASIRNTHADTTSQQSDSSMISYLTANSNSSENSNDLEFFALPSNDSQSTITTYAGNSSDSNPESEIDSNVYFKLLTPELNEDFLKTKDINTKEAIHEKLFNEIFRKKTPPQSNETFVQRLMDNQDLNRNR